MNKIILKGRLTANPELRRTQSDVSVCSFTVAVNRKFDRDKADFINCEAWRQTGEFVNKYFKKGQEILVVGELHIDKSERDGQIRFFTKVVADEVDFCGNKSDNVQPKTESSVPPDVEEITDDDDLPF
jgi:single-strand DNA-binding protein